MNDNRINNIIVEGEKVSNNYDGIVTRSKSKQHKDTYTQVAFKVKIIQILVREYQVILETERDAVNNAAQVIVQVLDSNQGREQKMMMMMNLWTYQISLIQQMTFCMVCQVILECTHKKRRI